MVIVKGSFPVKGAYSDEAMSLVKDFARHFRHESGCLAYEVYWHTDQPDTIVVWQRWNSSASFNTHFSSGSMDDFLDELAVLLDGEVDALRFDVQTRKTKAPLAIHHQDCVAGNVTIH